MVLHEKRQEPDDTPHKLYGHKLRRWHSALANSPTRAESLLHNLEQTAGGIGLHVDEDKTEDMWFDKKKTSPH